MRVFVTGASGFIGTEVVKELLAADHQVLGLVRSDEGAKKIEKLGAKSLRGDLSNLDSLKSGVRETDAVIHCAFNHDFSKFVANCAEDKQAILTMGEAMVGKKGPLIVTAGVGFNLDGKPRTENDPAQPVRAEWPRASEEAAATVAEKFKVPTIVVRLPQVHDTEKFGLITYSIEFAKQHGYAAYVGEGKSSWSAIAVSDCAKVYRLALEKGVGGANYNAVAETAVSSREVAEAIGRGLKIPVKSISVEEAGAYFSWMAMFANLDLSASSALTQERLGWKPTGPSLINDLDRATAFQTVTA